MGIGVCHLQCQVQPGMRLGEESTIVTHLYTCPIEVEESTSLIDCVSLFHLHRVYNTQSPLCQTIFKVDFVLITDIK